MLLPLLLAGSLVTPASAQEINLRNANLYYAVDDVRVQLPGIPLELQRVYNSRHNYNGYFGFGWTTNLDIRSQDAPDGAVVVTDSDGFQLYFMPQGMTRARMKERFIQSLVSARKEQDKRLGQERGSAYYNDMAQKLATDDAFFDQTSYNTMSGWIEPAAGDYISFDRGTERMKRELDGTVVRIRSDGSRYTFGPEGKLRSFVDVGGRGLELSYDREGFLTKIGHTDGGQISLSYTSDRRIGSILDTEGRRIEYGYDDAGNLVSVKGPEPRQLAYAYDDLHNLTAAREPDGQGFQISYDKARDWARAIKIGDEVTKYAWAVQSADQYSCQVIAPDGATTVHHFDDANNRQVTEYPDGSTEETLLSECCAKPLEVRTDAGVTRYDYDRDARLTSVQYPDGREVRFSYHPQWSRIVQAMHSDGRRYSYTYDAFGNLVEAVDGARRVLKLRYGDNGKVEVVRDQDSHEYRFTYDDYGRPVEISRGSEGALSIAYGLGGEIASTEISGGDASVDFYAELREVLSMLEPATGELQ